MNNADQVKKYIEDEKAKGTDLQLLTWNAAVKCVGWPYVFGASGQQCTPAYRRQAYASKGDDHPSIKTACQGFDSGNCSGCKWYPNGKRVLCFDCRGFTYKLLYMVYGWKLQGAGCTSQWNNADNWKAKGEISDGIPQDTIVCLFYYKKDKKGNRTKTLEHTGFYYNGQTCECSSGVQKSTTLGKKWEVWGVPACVDKVVPVPTPTPEPKPDQGTAVVTGKNVAIRQGPGTNYSVMTRVPTGKTVQLKDIPEGWTYVSYNGKTGFMMDEFMHKGSGEK